MSAILADAANGLETETDPTINEFLKRMSGTDAAKPSDEGDEDEKEHDEPAKANRDEPEASEETPEDEGDDDAESDQDESESDDDEETEKPKAKGKVIDDDEAVTKIKVDGKELDVPLKDLKRLYGQEQALTRKSQEAAELRKQSEDTGKRHVAGLSAMLDRAQERAKPYANINFLALSKDPNVSADELQHLYNAAKSAHEDVQYLQGNLDNVIKEAEVHRRNELGRQAVEAIKVLTDPVKGIEGWSDAVYNDIRKYATDSGLPASLVNEIVDPTAIKLIHKAMLYDKGAKASATKVTKVAKTPTRITKGSSEQKTIKAKGSTVDKAMANLRKTHSQEAAADAFLARMGG